MHGSSLFSHRLNIRCLLGEVTFKNVSAAAISFFLLGSVATIAANSSLAQTAPSGLQFIPVTPCRVVDTRGALGPFGGPKLAAGTTREIDIPSGACSIPTSAVAYSLNVTVVPDAALTYLTLWPSGQTQPNVSTLNSDGRVKANAAITPAGSNGGVSVFVSDATQVILDIDGYFVPDGTTSALAFYPVTPCRMVDTRQAAGPLGGPFLAGGSSRSFPLQTSSCGIPAGARAYSLNVTAVPHATLNYLTSWPTGQAQPNVSTLNSSTGAVAANAAVVPAGTGEAVSIFVSDAADVILDVNGYFAAPSANGLDLYTTTPCRVLDTRSSSGVFTGVLAVDIQGGVCPSSAAAQAFVLNATVVPAGPLNYLTLWPDLGDQPNVSTLNADDGAITSNMAIVPALDGSIDAFSSDSTHLILDISSYFGPPPATAPSIPTPVVASVSPAQFTVGSPATMIAVDGTGFTSASVVQWNGTALTTSYVPNTGFGASLNATVTASLLSAAVTAEITVNTPGATPSVSNSFPVTVVNTTAPTLTSISQNYGPIDTNVAVTLFGSGFAANSTVSFNGIVISSTYSDSGTMTAMLPASSIAVPGNGSFTVTTPGAGGGTTAPLLFSAYIGIPNNSMVYNPSNHLFYVSVPSLAGAPYGNSVVSVDPVTGALGAPISVGSEPNKLAITSDGRYLWVGLDGASAVRQVDLATNTAGMQFTLGNNTGVYASPETALALAALPGAPNSVIVSTSNLYEQSSLAIFDSGVMRANTNPDNNYGAPSALQVDGSRSEVYAGSYSSYNVYTYDANGLTLETSANAGSYATDEMQVADGRLYTDFGVVYDAEAGYLLGTFYDYGTTVAIGPTFADTALGRVFILDTPNSNYGNPLSQIQVFDPVTFLAATAETLTVNVPPSGYYVPGVNASQLTRWGRDGLAFQTSVGVYSLRSNLVDDLSDVISDLGVTLASSGSSATGGNTTYTATITNAGPAVATDVALLALTPSSGVLVSATPANGTCSLSGIVSCSLGSISAGGSTTVTFVVTQLSSGSAVFTVQVSGSETDSNLANNQASSTVTITGGAYNPAPSLSSISPATVLAGSGDTSITVTGTGFTGASSIVLNGVELPTTVATPGTQLAATVPAAQVASLGWNTVSVSNPAPGGGTSTALPLSVFSVINLSANHILYDPYSRKIIASLSSAESQVMGNSLIAITPDTVSLGAPVSIGSQPTNLALTSDGQILYTILSGSQSVVRFNMLTGQLEYTYSVSSPGNYYSGTAMRGVAAQPGTEDTIALDLGEDNGNAIYDFDPANKTAAIRGQASGAYTGSCIQFLDAADLYSFDVDTTGATFNHFTVTSSGLNSYGSSQYYQSTLNDFGCFQLNGGLAFANAGGVANPSTNPATQLGVFSGLPGGEFSTTQNVAPDMSLDSVFFLVATGENPSGVNAVAAYDPATYLLTTIIPVDIPAIEGNNNSYNTIDFIRWGQDGLAALTSGGHIYLLRGAAVVPQLLNRNTPATLTSSSTTTLPVGSGNTLLMLTGGNFIPGVAVTWNGGYRTTTILDPAHVTVAIPSTDLSVAATGSLVAINPGALSSSALTITVQ
jgi:hypothetical protein